MADLATSKMLLFVLSILALIIGAWLAHGGDPQAKEFLLTAGGGVIGALLRDLQDMPKA